MTRTRENLDRENLPPVREAIWDRLKDGETLGISDVIELPGVTLDDLLWLQMQGCDGALNIRQTHDDIKWRLP